MNKLQKGSYEIFIDTEEYYTKEYLSKYINLEENSETILRRMGNKLGFLSKHTDTSGTIYIVKDAVSYEERQTDFANKFKIELCIPFSDSIENITQEEMDKRVTKLNESLANSNRKTLAQSIPLTDFKYLG